MYRPNVPPCVLPFTSLNHNRRKVLSLRLESYITDSPSIPPNEKQAINVLNPAVTTPRLPNIDISDVLRKGILV